MSAFVMNLYDNICLAKNGWYECEFIFYSIFIIVLFDFIPQFFISIRGGVSFK